MPGAVRQTGGGLPEAQLKDQTDLMAQRSRIAKLAALVAHLAQGTRLTMCSCLGHDGAFKGDTEAIEAPISSPIIRVSGFSGVIAAIAMADFIHRELGSDPSYWPAGRLIAESRSAS